jgi:preprotein translocase subunit SecE
MSAEINEKRGRRRRAADTKTQVVDTDSQVIAENQEMAEAVQKGITAPKGRPTVGRRNRQQVEEPEGNVVTRTISAPQEYIQGVREELRKVSWPNREEVFRLTRVVLVVTVLAAVTLGAISFAFTILFQQGLQNPLIFVVFFAVAAGMAFLGYRYYRRTSGDITPNYPTRL